MSFPPNRSRARRLLLAWLALPLLANAPVAGAWASLASAPSMDCAGMGLHGEAQAQGEECPCCPDGRGDTASCLGNCLSLLAATPPLSSAGVVQTIYPPERELTPPRPTAVEPPLKPPPIA
jgi:hypothetical protein